MNTLWQELIRAKDIVSSSTRDNLWFLAITAGIFFGSWPLLMKESGLKGVYGAMMLIMAELAMLFFGFITARDKGLPNIHVKWWWLFMAGSAAAIGMLAFLRMDSHVKMVTTIRGRLYGTVYIVQLTIAMALHYITNSGFTLRKLVAFVLAMLVVYLLYSEG
jgi:hypothetical protein